MKRSKFNLSHSFKFSSNLASLVPVLVEDVVPGDTFKVSTDAMVRFAPLIAPLMHEVDVCTHYFFVPNRLIWSEWEDFVTGGERGEFITTFPESPTVVSPAGGFALGSLADYMGMPTGQAGVSVSALPFRAYVLILNEWYRQEMLQDSLVMSKDSGVDSTTDLTLYNRNWNKDYFTSCLPSQQKGPQVVLPLEGNAPVIGNAPVSGLGIRDVALQGTRTAVFDSSYGSDQTYSQALTVSGSAQPGVRTPIFKVTGTSVADAVPQVFADAEDSRSTMQADLSQVVAASINDLRRSVKLQQFQEKNLLAGSRYTEFILSQYGIHSSDSRLQRPEFLGGGRSPIMFSEVLQTSSTDGTSPLATFAGHGISAHRSHQFVKSFREHGWVIGLMSVMPKSGYSSQGVERRFSRKTRYDYLMPVFDGLGEQAVLNKEIYASGDDAVDSQVFGYQPQYQDYRKRLNRVAAQFKDTLDFWHLARKFDAVPALNASFINCNPSKRIFADTDASDDSLFIHCYHRVSAIRPLSKRGTPGIYKI